MQKCKLPLSTSIKELQMHFFFLVMRKKKKEKEKKKETHVLQ